MNLSVIKQIVEAEMASKHNPPNYMERNAKYEHGQRTAVLAVRLRKLILPAEEKYDDILTVAAWFHDVCHGEDNHWTAGARRAKELLADYCTSDELEQICDIIAVHDDRTLQCNYSDIIKIHQDADFLDHLGTHDIWVHAAHVGALNGTINEKLRYFRDVRPGEAARWRTEINFEICKPIFDEKLRYVASFVERLAVENAGGIWDEDVLL